MSGYSLSAASASPHRGYTRGESVLFSKKALIPVGLTVASAIAAYYLFKYSRDKRDAAEGDDMFTSKGPINGISNGATTKKGAKIGATDAMEEQRKKALDDLLRIMGAGKMRRAGEEDDDFEDEDEEGEEVEEGEEDPNEYIHRFFEYQPMPEGFAEARTYCLAAVDAAMAVLAGRKPKKGKKSDDDDFVDDESNPDPVLQVATQIEVSLRHRLAYFAQEFGFSFFKDDEDASEVCATYAGVIPKPPHMPKEGLGKKVLLEAVKEYLEVCQEIDRTKPIVVEHAVKEAVEGGKGDTNAWKHIADRDADVAEAGPSSMSKSKKSSGKRSYIDNYEDGDEDDEAEDDEEVAPARPTSSIAVKEAALGRMLAAREQRFMGQHASEQMDAILHEKQQKMMKLADKMAGRARAAAKRTKGAEEDSNVEFEDESEGEDEEADPEEDLAYIGEPLHDVNRRAFEAALIRAVLAQISAPEDPMSKPHLAVLDTVAAQYKEPSEEDEEDDDWGYGDDDGEDYYDPMAMMRRNMPHNRGGMGPMGGMEDDDEAYDDEDDYDDEGDDEDPMHFQRMMMAQAARMGMMGMRGGRGGGMGTRDQMTRANINMMMGEASAADHAAMFVDDEDDEDDDFYGGFDMGGDDESREAFIRDMIQREAAEYSAMQQAGGRRGAKARSAKRSQFVEDDEWVDE